MTDAALALRGLTKSFGATKAVRGVELEIPLGSMYALVGPNGAGKTTTLSMAVGDVRPDAGSAEICGIDVQRERSRALQLVEMMPDAAELPQRLTADEVLVYLGLLRGMDPGVVERRSRELVDVLGLAEASRTLVIDYSTGMRKKLCLATALLHAPRVLVLDEPFESVDPVSGSTIRAILERYVRTGDTVVISSHVMALVERLCDHVAILHHGPVRVAGTMAGVLAGRTLDDVFTDVIGRPDLDADALSWLAS